MFSSHATPAIPIFQSYLLPSLPFRRRRSSVDTQASPPVAGFSPIRHGSLSTAATSPPASLPGSPASDQHAWEPDYYSFSPTDRGQYLTGHTSTMSCARCHAHLALTSQIISKGFTGRHGRAYLVSPAVTPFSPSEAHHRRSSLSFFKTSVIGRFNSSSPSSSLTSRSPPVYSNPFASSTTAGQSDSNASDSGTPHVPRDRSQSTPAPQQPHSPQRRHSTTIPDPKTLPNTHTHRSAPRRLVTGMHTVADITCMVCGSQLGWKYVAAEEDAQRYKVGKFILEAKRVIVGVDWESPFTAGHGIKEDGDSFNELDEMFGASSLNNNESEMPAEDDEILFDSQDEDECEDLFAGVWSPALARRRRRMRPNNA